MKQLRLKLTALAALLLFCSSFLGATSMVPTNIAELVQHSERAIAGTIESVDVVQTKDGWAEEIRLKVSESLLGDSKAGDVVTWQQYRQGEEIRLPGMPQYRVGEEHVIFLSKPAPGTGYRAAFALGQGSFRVHRNQDTGEVFLRNEFMNVNLIEKLNVDRLAEEIVAEETATRATAMTAEERAQKVNEVRVQLYSSSQGSITLDSMKSLVDHIAAHDQPAERYRLDEKRSSPTREPLFIQPHK